MVRLILSAEIASTWGWGGSNFGQMQWFYSQNGQQVGPVDFAEIERLQAAGELTPDSLVWKDGSPDWVKLSEVLPSGSAPQAQPATESLIQQPGPAVPASSDRKDYGDLLCWGFIAIVVPCLGAFVLITLIVLNCLEFFETRREVEAGRLEASDYSRTHPALFLIGLICCGWLLYPVFMHLRNKSGYFKPQPYAVIVSIVVVVVSMGLGLMSGFMKLAVEAAKNLPQ